MAVDLAAKDGARGLILQSTFTSLPDAGGAHVRWLPTHWIMTHRLDSLAKIPRYQGPLLQSHGDADEVIPYKLGRKLFEAAPGPKRFVTLPGGTHNAAPTVEYQRELEQFFDAVSFK